MTTPTPPTELVERLKRYFPHLECEDSWYSCPLSKEGCSNDKELNRCTCGSEARTELVANFIRALPPGPDALKLSPALCDNCGRALLDKGNEKCIADGEEAFCSTFCLDQHEELSCPQEHGGEYRNMEWQGNALEDVRREAVKPWREALEWYQSQTHYFLCHGINHHPKRQDDGTCAECEMARALLQPKKEGE